MRSVLEILYPLNSVVMTDLNFSNAIGGLAINAVLKHIRIIKTWVLVIYGINKCEDNPCGGFIDTLWLKWYYLSMQKNDSATPVFDVSEVSQPLRF